MDVFLIVHLSFLLNFMIKLKQLVSFVFQNALNLNRLKFLDLLKIFLMDALLIVHHSFPLNVMEKWKQSEKIVFRMFKTCID